MSFSGGLARVTDDNGVAVESRGGAPDIGEDEYKAVAEDLAGESGFWRDPRVILILVACSVELTTRFVREQLQVFDTVARVASAIAIFSLAATLVMIMLCSSRSRSARRTAIAAVILFLAVQFLAIVAMTDYWNGVFEDGLPEHIRSVVKDISEVGGVAMLILSYYFSIREAQRARTRLARERSELAQEVAERRRAEAALRESEERFRLLFNGIQEGIAFYGKDMKALFFNEPAVKLLGYRPEELMGADPRIAIHPDDFETVRKYHLMRLAGETPPRTYELRLLHRDGHVVHCEASFDPIYRDGEIIGVQGIYRDISQRKRAEKALQESEKHYRQLLEGISDAIYVIDGNGRIVAANEQAEVQHGYTHEELMSLAYADICAHADQDRCAQRIANVLAVGDARWESVRRRKDATTFPVDVSARRIEYQGRTGVLLISRDITDRKRVEEALQTLAEGVSPGRGAEIFQRLVLSLGTALDFEHVYLIGSDATDENACQMLAACSDGLLIENAVFPFPDPRQIELGEEGVSLYTEGVCAAYPDNDHLRRMGAESCVGAPLYGATGKWLGFLVAFGRSPLVDSRNAVSLTRIFAVRAASELERKRTIQALRLSEERLRTLLEGIEDVLVVYDAEGNVLDCNAAACQHFGYTRQEFIGIKVRDLESTRLHRDPLQRIAHQFTQGKTVFDAEHITKGGGRIPVEIYTRRINYKGIPAILQVARDISERLRNEAERQRLQEQMQHAQKLESLGVLAGGIAHDFNNLLMGVLGNASLALLDLPSDSSAHECVHQIESAAQRAADLSKQMLAYSGKGRFVNQAVSLSGLVDEIGPLLQASVSKKVDLRFEYAPDLPLVEGDPSQLRQIVVNLVTNASDSIGDASGAVTVATGAVDASRDYLRDTYLCEELEEGMYAFIEVRDTGCGMEADMLGKIFDPFFTTKFTGRGLGLAAVMGIVRGHKGAIKVRSEQGVGSTFTVLLPAMRREEPVIHRPQSSGTQFHDTGTILLVDDEETVRMVTRRVLERAGYRVITACDGVEGVEAFQAHNDEIALVLLDMTMPRMSGDEAFREIRKIRSDVPVLVSSGYNEPDALDRFTSSGVSGFIQKPYRADELIAKLHSAMEWCPA